MGRKRAPENDWICQRCGCPCMPAGVQRQRHIGGGQGMRACRAEPDPILRTDYEREVAEAVSHLYRGRFGNAGG